MLMMRCQVTTTGWHVTALIDKRGSININNQPSRFDQT